MAHPGAGVGGLVLDSGVLMEWFICSYENRTEAEWPNTRFNLHFLRSPGDLRRWEGALRRYPGKLYMSAYSIAEVQRHVRDAEKECYNKQDFRQGCWRTIQEVLQRFPVHEHHISWTALDEGLLHDHGPADASIVTITRQLMRQGHRPCIVTLDGPLRGRCRRLDLAAQHPDELVQPELA